MIFCRMSRLERFTRLRFCKSFCNFKVVLGDPWEFRTKQRHQSQILKVQHMTMCLSKNDKKKLKICPKNIIVKQIYVDASLFVKICPKRIENQMNISYISKVPVFMMVFTFYAELYFTFLYSNREGGAKRG